ncbi:hypothetical protein N9350_01165 [Gammaproteobacteria bacterium]|nr:hypothetical protein [Gammaproteobacteria bacterium]
MADAYIPRLRAVREAVGGTYDPERRPGSGGQRYFSDVEYANPRMAQRVYDPEAAGYETQVAYDTRFDAAMDAATDAARDTTRQQATGLQALNLSNLAMQQRPVLTQPSAPTDSASRFYKPGEGIGSLAGFLDTQKNLVSEASRRLPVGMTPAQRGVTSALQDAPDDMVAQLLNMGIFTPETAAQFYQSRYPGLTPEQVQESLSQYGYAQGGNVKGMYLGGPTDGMADQIPATIDNRQPAALSDGEFVIPADVVSHLGNGNSNSGAQQLYGMMDKIRKARTGSTEQGKQINPQKFLA